MRYRSYPGFDLNPILVLIIINFIVFIATAILGERLIFALLGLQPASLLAQPWTIGTNMFVHAGIWHILTNMLTLYFFGSYLMRLVGEKKFLAVYFAGGLLGNILFILLSFLGILWGLSSLGNPFATAVGASGAVFALGGALTVMRPKLPVFIFPFPVSIPLWVAVIGGFFILTSSNIAWQAHLGGLILGLVAGYFFRKRERYIF